MQLRHIILAFIFSLVSFSAVGDEGRSISSVERLLVGSWSVTNMIIEPGQPFIGSKEEKELLDYIWSLKVNELMGATTFVFFQDKTYAISMPKDNQKVKVMKGEWKLEEDGDILVTTEKKRLADKVKILLIDENALELLYSFDENVMLVFKRNDPQDGR